MCAIVSTSPQFQGQNLSTQGILQYLLSITAEDKAENLARVKILLWLLLYRV